MIHQAKTLYVMFWIILSVSAVSAGEIREIELLDGSVISAEILSFSNGVYTLQSEMMGKLLIEDSKIREIRSKSSAQKAHPAGENPSAVSGMNLNGLNLQGLQDRITGNPDTMNIIKSLQNDPDIQKIIQDPELMQAINNGDISALITNPDFLKLLENPKIQGITQGLAK